MKAAHQADQCGEKLRFRSHWLETARKRFLKILGETVLRQLLFTGSMPSKHNAIILKINIFIFILTKLKILKYKIKDNRSGHHHNCPHPEFLGPRGTIFG